MTAQITTIPGGTSQAAVSGTTIRAEPGVRYEIADIAPDGTVGPALTAAQLTMAPNVPDVGDMSVTLPDGTILVFKGMIELFALGAGLSAGGDLVVASLEDLIAPAAGDAGTAPDGGGSSQAFNLASPGSPNDFGDAPEGRFDPEDSGIAPLTGEDPNDFVAPEGPAPAEAEAPVIEPDNELEPEPDPDDEDDEFVPSIPILSTEPPRDIPMPANSPEASEGDGPGTAGKDPFVFKLGEATGDEVIEDYDLGDDTLRFDDVLGAGEDAIAALEKVVDVTEEGDDVVITRTDGKGTIRIEGIAEAGEFDSVQDLANATTLEINA